MEFDWIISFGSVIYIDDVYRLCKLLFVFFEYGCFVVIFLYFDFDRGFGLDFQ